MKFSINKITTVLAITCLLTGSALANEQRQKEKKNEVVGLSSGVVIGTIIAGPLGGIIAGTFGLLIAEDVNSDKRLEIAKSSLQQKQQELLIAQKQFNQEKQQALLHIASLDKALEQLTPNIESNIQFKTGSHVLEEVYKSQLDLLSQTLVNNPKLSVSLSGFADQRGDDKFNQALSEQRAIAVRTYLLKNGVKLEQVLTNSFGETSLASAASNFEDDFFDRRVHLKVSEKTNSMTASNQ